MVIIINLGEKKEIGLLDGSWVILNEDSKLVFFEEFGDKREVCLVGEGYFFVMEDVVYFFVIDCFNGYIEVLGIVFNLCVYLEEDFVEVEVESGKVMFSCLNGED